MKLILANKAVLQFGNSRCVLQLGDIFIPAGGRKQLSFEISTVACFIQFHATCRRTGIAQWGKYTQYNSGKQRFPHDHLAYYRVQGRQRERVKFYTSSFRLIICTNHSRLTWHACTIYFEVHCIVSEFTPICIIQSPPPLDDWSSDGLKPALIITTTILSIHSKTIFEHS